ncbi:bifunctional folylpolyglutamate synthase/dihydrofolate synthase, partial [bacterium]|nr:bifunctional folylpolyglutamate synthase/dihydrofolate synthase [bacterium]
MSPNYLDYLYNLGIFNIKLGLTTISRMLEKLGNPHNHPRIIHIAGTNGKGSTLVTLEKLLLDSGFSTGSTISPHLVSFNERFRINARQVDDNDLEYSFNEVCQACG